MTETPTSDAPSSRGRLGGAGRARAGTGLLLVILCAVQFVDAYDIAAMGPALPKIQSDLDMTPEALQWVVTAYVLGYGGFLLVGGRLADLFDRKRLLIGAMSVFVVACFVGGIATSGELLIAARLAQGIAAGFTAPASLAILLHTYSDETERNKALGLYLSIAAIGFTSGLVLGGVLADVTWRLVMFVPAALGLIVMISAVRVIPRIDHREGGERGQVDLLGAMTVTPGLLALVYGVSRAPTKGWTDPLTVASLVAAVVLIVLFVLIERVRRSPLVPLEIFSRPGLSQANTVIFLMQGAYVGWQFVATLYLQHELDWSPVEVGLTFAPGGLMVALTAQRWAGQVGKVGAWPIGSAGLLLLGLGLVWSLQLDNLNGLVTFGISQVAMGAGYAMIYPAMNITAVAGARTDEEGLASGLFIAAFQIGSGVILGIVASVFTATAGEVTVGTTAYRAGILTSIGVAALALLICLVGVARNARPSVAPTEAPAVQEEPSCA
jgi:MFS family permease